MGLDIFAASIAGDVHTEHGEHRWSEKFIVMRNLFTYGAILSLLFTAASLTAQSAGAGKPNALQCDALSQPLGDDNKAPLLSWKLQDSRMGAKQTAYRILVASRPALLEGVRPDIWDSGKEESDQSVDVSYKGPHLLPETRYYWRVQVWDGQGQPYPMSDVSWWETGLMEQSHWVGKWIGYEDREQRSIREAAAQWVTNTPIADYKGDGPTQHDFRINLHLNQTVRFAALYVTGEDTAAAWINGKQVVPAQTQPAWGRTPWRTYTRKDVTAEMHTGENLVAIEVTHFRGRNQTETPMSAILYVEGTDGNTQVFKTGTPEWKAKFSAQGDWHQSNYDDSSWASAISYMPDHDAFGGQDKIGNPIPTASVSSLRRAFQVKKHIVSARLYGTALGSYKFSLNGKPVGDQVLAPGWTDFREHVTYQTYDVTSLLLAGGNTLGAYLAPGWYATPLEWVGQGNNYGDTPNALRAQLRIAYSDGTVEWISTDQSWKAAISPITFAEIYDGETYDARRLQRGWDTPAFSDAKWQAVSLIQPYEPEIVWQSFQPIRTERILEPKSVTSPKPGVFIYDFGQDMAGVAKVRLHGNAGTEVQLRFGELLKPDGILYVDNLRNAKATDHFILAGHGTEEYQPSFTFHGFRYVELSGVPENPGLGAIQTVVLHTDAPLTAQLKTGNAMVNQLWSNILWGQRSNFVGVPTDCPQRDERLGWAADAQVFWRTATFNMDLTAFSRKYSADLRGTQAGTAMYGIYAPGTGKPNPGYGPGWSDAGVIVPWTSWIQTGDTSIIRQNWAGMASYLDAIQTLNPDYLWKNKSGIAFGDWLAPEGATAEGLIATAYWAYDVSLMQQMAHAIGQSDDEQKYAELFQNIKAAFIRAYVHSDGVVSAVVESHEGENGASGHAQKPIETQTGYVLALHMNLLPASLREAAATRLVDRIATNGWKLGTGFLGTPYLLEVLSDTGHSDVAYRLLLNTTYPSWGYMVEHGATTMWERWNGDKMIRDPGMNSFNHYAYGAVAEWIYRYAAGIDTSLSGPGFHTVLLHPNFDARIGSIDLSYESRYGAIHSAWHINGDTAAWTITIPPNTTGCLALTPQEEAAYNLEGKSFPESSLIATVKGEAGQHIYEFPSGTYHLTYKMTR